MLQLLALWDAERVAGGGGGDNACWSLEEAAAPVAGEVVEDGEAAGPRGEDIGGALAVYLASRAGRLQKGHVDGPEGSFTCR